MDTQFACQECEKRYTQYGRLQLHLQQKHGISDQAVLKCDNCDKYFDTVKRLNQHKKVVNNSVESFKLYRKQIWLYSSMCILCITRISGPLGP